MEVMSQDKDRKAARCESNHHNSANIQVNQSGSQVFVMLKDFLRRELTLQQESVFSRDLLRSQTWKFGYVPSSKAFGCIFEQQPVSGSNKSWLQAVGGVLLSYLFIYFPQPGVLSSKGHA